MKTKNYLEKDRRKRAKQTWVEELGSSQSGRTRQKVLVRQRGGNYGLTGAMRLDDDDLHSTFYLNTGDKKKS